MKVLCLRRLLGHNEALILICGQSEVNLDNPFIFVRIKHGVHLLVCVYKLYQVEESFFSFPQNEARYKGRALDFWYLVPKGDACGLLRKPILAQSRKRDCQYFCLERPHKRSFRPGYARSQGRRKTCVFDLIKTRGRLLFHKTALVRYTNKYVYLAFFNIKTTRSGLIWQG